MDIEGRLLKLLGATNYTPLDARQLAGKLGLAPARREEFNRVLQKLEQTGRVARVRENRYALPLEADLIPGRILINRQGKGILQPDDPHLPRLVIPAENTANALHLDRVLARREASRPASRQGGAAEPSGKVIRILQRSRNQVVGTLQRSKQFLYVIPDDPRIPHDIYVVPGQKVREKARVGEKVVVELEEWLSRHNNPEGRIVEVLGEPDNTEVEMESLLRQYNLSKEFPSEALRESRAYGNDVGPEEHKGRRDCRQHAVITIDPDDAKDFDDAFYLERAGQNRWKLWVHIADVSHYVKPGTALDAEARRRGNSTYLVDRVIPMLPEILSNELCSLKPRVDRLTKCVEFLLADDGKVLGADFYSAVIHSQRRFTYKEAFACLQRQPASAVERMLADANRLAQRVRRHRMRAGSLDLDFPEFKIRLNDQKLVDRVERVENDISHQLIEEFMLLANEAVALRLKNIKRSSIYRIHEQPDPERLEELREEMLVYGIRCGNLVNRREVQKLLAQLKDHELGPALKISFLRSLKRARYAIEPLGHYGLAKVNYTHFTSPIRRYADLVVHQALFANARLSRDALADAADHISLTERNSDDAEKDSKSIKLMGHFARQIKSGRPERYEALVTEVRNFGFAVDLAEIGMSGFVRVSTMDDDFYRFDAQRFMLVGKRRRRTVRLGDKVWVAPHSVDRFKKQVDFRLVPQTRR